MTAPNTASHTASETAPQTAPHTVTAFRGSARLAHGALADVARVAFDTLRADIITGADAKSTSADRSVLIFDDQTGRVIDLEMRGGERAMMASLEARGLLPRTPAASTQSEPHTADAHEQATAPRGRGRPKLGVVPREVTLLPRHWEWLASQPGGASVALRKLVEAARKAQADNDLARTRRDAAYAAMVALAGDRPRFEDASRALFRNDITEFTACMARWPRDVRAYILRLLQGT